MGFVSGYNEAQSDDTQQIKVVGMPAHKWLLSRRIELAKEKLRDGRSSLSDVALACGFSDQSHLTRIFSRLVSITPGAWRRVLDE
jgi:AraC family transcriptional regulator